LVTADPGNPVLQDGSAYIQELIAESRSAQRRYGDAVGAYRIALEVRARIADAAPGDAAKQVARASVTEKLAEALLDDTNNSEALKYARDNCLEAAR
jgi:hypothetical protein